MTGHHVQFPLHDRPTITRVGRIELRGRQQDGEPGLYIEMAGWEFDGERPEKLDAAQTLAVVEWLEAQATWWRELVSRNGLGAR